MSSSSQIPKKRTLTIDDETMRILREYGYTNNGNNNVSAAIRSMARDWQFRHAIDKQNNDIVGSVILRHVQQMQTQPKQITIGANNELTTSRW